MIPMKDNIPWFGIFCCVIYIMLLTQILLSKKCKVYLSNLPYAREFEEVMFCISSWHCANYLTNDALCCFPLKHGCTSVYKVYILYKCIHCLHLKWRSDTLCVLVCNHTYSHVNNKCQWSYLARATHQCSHLQYGHTWVIIKTCSCYFLGST